MVESQYLDSSCCRFSYYDRGLVLESRQQPEGVPGDVAAIRRRIRAFLDTVASNGKKIGNAKWGVYAFYDYDGEPSMWVKPTKCYALEFHVT